MAAAIEGLRRPYSPLPSIKTMPERLECNRNNILINAEWSAGPAESVSLELDRAAVAVASALIVSCGEQALASKVAAEEGIVSHLTSLVLVDEASSTQEALPALRKVALPSADVMYSACYDSIDASEDRFMSASSQMASPPLFERSMRYSRPRAMISPSRGPASPAPLARKASLARLTDSKPRDLKGPGALGKLLAKLTGGDRQSIVSLLNDEIKSLARQIDWGHSPRDLIRGDLSELSGDVAAFITRLSKVEAVAKFAELNGLTSEVLVIGLLARSIASEDRRANRVWKAISDLMTASVPEELAELELQIIASL